MLKKTKLILLGILLIIFTITLTSSVIAESLGHPWKDWPDTDTEAGYWLKDQGYLKGFEDETFRPHIEITQLQFSVVLDRAGIDSSWPRVINIGEALKYLPNTVISSKYTDTLTRYRFSVMLYRHLHEITFPPVEDPDKIVIDKLEQWFNETRVTWNGVTRSPKLIGHASLIVKLSREYNIPIWLALGQCWRESQWFTTGLSTKYNCGWGVKVPGYGCTGDPSSIRGFINYISVEEDIRAYFKYMADPKNPYRALIDKGDDESIRKALNIYAPAFENDTWQHWMIVKTVRDWCYERDIE